MGDTVLNTDTIDSLARRLSAGLPRRNAFALLLAALPPIFWPPGDASAKCKKVGKKCDKSKDCCNGASCKGGKHGKCRCKNGKQDCGQECVDLGNNDRHCGACDTACASDEACCDGTCQDFQSDPANCGACGTACESNETCCDGACVDLYIDPENCGSCGRACGEFDPNCVGFCTGDGGCPAGADSCAGGGNIACAGNCACSQSTEGGTLCGDLTTPGAACGQCESSSDCASLGPGHFCVATGTVACCRGGAPNVCRRVCTD